MTFQQLSLFKSSNSDYPSGSGQSPSSLQKTDKAVRLYDVEDRPKREDILSFEANPVHNSKQKRKAEQKQTISKAAKNYLASHYLENLQEKIIYEEGDEGDQYEEFICPPKFPLANLEKALFSPVDFKVHDDPGLDQHKGFLPLFYIYGDSGVGKSHLLWKWFFALKQFEKQLNSQFQSQSQTQSSNKTKEKSKNLSAFSAFKTLWLEKLSSSFIEEMLELLSYKNMRLYVFIDDLNENLAQTDQLHIFCQLVDLSLRHRNQLSYIAAGPCPIIELSKIFTLDKLSARLSLFSDYPLRPLDKAGEEQFVRWQGKKLGLSDEAIQIILQNERQKSLVRPFNGFFWQGILHRYLWEDSLPRPASAQQLCLWDQASEDKSLLESSSSSSSSFSPDHKTPPGQSPQGIPSVTIPLKNANWDLPRRIEGKDEFWKDSSKDYKDHKDSIQSIVERYQKMICHLFEISKESLCSRQRIPHVVLARHLFVYALYQTGQVNRHQLAKKIGMDHSSVLYILSKVRDALRIKGHPLQVWYEKFLIVHR